MSASGDFMSSDDYDYDLFVIGSGPAGLTLPVIETLTEAIRPSMKSYNLPEGDLLIDCAFTGTEGE